MVVFIEGGMCNQFWSKRSLFRRLAAANVVTTIFGNFGPSGRCAGG